MESAAVLLLGLEERAAGLVQEALEALQDRHCRVLQAATFDEAQAHLQVKAPALLLMDGCFLLKSGYSSRQKLKFRKRESGLRSLLVVPEEGCSRELRLKAAESEFDDLLFLPIEAEALSNLLDFQLVKARQNAVRQTHFQRLESAAGIAFWEFDPEQGQLEWSETLFRLLGYKPWEVTPSKELARGHVHPDDLPLVERTIERVESRKTLDLVFRYVHRDGEVRFARIQAEANAEGLPGIIGTFQDVTQRKRVENKLVELLEQTQMRSHETQAMLEGTKAILEHQSFTLAVRRIMDECQKLIDGSFGLVGVNDGGSSSQVALYWLKGLGKKQARGLGEKIPQSPIWHELQKAKRVVKLNEPSGRIVPHLFPCEGNSENLLAAPIIIQEQLAGAIVLAGKTGGFTDDDARMLAGFSELVAVSLRNSRNLERTATLATALEQSGEGVVITDSRLQAMYVNPAFERMSGFEGSEVAQSFPAILWGLEDDALLEEAWHSISSGRLWRGQLQVERKDGSSYRTEVSASPIVDQEGGISNYLVIVRDVTEKFELERQLRQSQKMEAIGTLAGGIAHDFNNILMGIMGFTEMALRNLPPGREMERKYLNSVLKSIYRAKDLVHQILTFSRQKETHKQPLRVDTALKEAVKLLEASLPSNIEIICHIDSEAPQVMADPAQIHQVVMNLCTNAAQAMPDGGTLTVRLGPKDLDDSSCRQLKRLEPGRFLLIEVADTGRGIEPDIRERIFEPFFTTKSQDKGTGMGLAVIHGIVSELSGEIQVTSLPDQGSTFSVYIPATEGDSRPARQKGGLAEELARGKGRILFVDDEEDIVVWGVRSLEQLGYKVTGIADSQQAWEIIQEKTSHFDLVVTDLTMPKISGREFIKRVRELRPDLPVILCTGYSEEVQAEAEAAAGADALLIKPFSMSEFSWTVRSVLERGLYAVSEPGGV